MNDRAVIEALGADVYHMVFQLLDAQAHIDSGTAGKIATKCERVVRELLAKELGEQPVKRKG